MGRIGRCHCASVASVPTKATVTMICDIFQPALDSVSATFHVPKTTTDPMEVRCETNLAQLVFHPVVGESDHSGDGVFDACVCCPVVASPFIVRGVPLDLPHKLPAFQRQSREFGMFPKAEANLPLTPRSGLPRSR